MNWVNSMAVITLIATIEPARCPPQKEAARSHVQHVSYAKKTNKTNKSKKKMVMNNEKEEKMNWQKLQERKTTGDESTRESWFDAPKPMTSPPVINSAPTTATLAIIFGSAVHGKNCKKNVLYRATFPHLSHIFFCKIFQCKNMQNGRLRLYYPSSPWKSAQCLPPTFLLISHINSHI